MTRARVPRNEYSEKGKYLQMTVIKTISVQVYIQNSVKQKELLAC